MNTAAITSIPHRAETLQVLRLMGNFQPILMLGSNSDGYGTRWLVHGLQIQPSIASYLMRAGFVSESGTTELGARKLTLTTSGARFRECGERWWASLSLAERLKARLFG